MLDSLNRKETVFKGATFTETVEWCQLNGHRSWKAVSSGPFPGIRDLCAIKKHLHGEIMTGKEREHWKILTETGNRNSFGWMSFSFITSVMNFK